MSAFVYHGQQHIFQLLQNQIYSNFVDVDLDTLKHRCRQNRRSNN